MLRDGDEDVSISKSAMARKMNAAERESAELMVKEIQENYNDVNEAIESFFEQMDIQKKAPQREMNQVEVKSRGDGRKKKVHKNALRNQREEDEKLDAMIRSFCRPDVDQELMEIMRFLYRLGEVFQFPEKYGIVVADSDDKVEKWIKSTLQDIGQYLCM